MFIAVHNAEAALSTHDPGAAKQTPRSEGRGSKPTCVGLDGLSACRLRRQARLCRSAGGAPSRGSAEGASGVIHLDSSPGLPFATLPGLQVMTRMTSVNTYGTAANR